MKYISTGFLVLFSLSLAVQAASERYHPNNLFIKLKPGQSLPKSDLIRSSKKLFNNLYLVKTKDIESLESQVASSGAAEYVQKDFYSEKEVMPKLETLEPADLVMKRMFPMELFKFNDPEVGRLWAFLGTQGMDVNGAYDILPNITPEEVIVAVVDTGVDASHEDLKDIMWVNSGEIPADGKDNDGNGYIDDIHGINVLVRDAAGRATMNTMASHWHGTHVSGTIAATQNNGIGIAGVANNVKIMAIRTVPDAADELDSDIVEAFLYATKNGARVINCSFGKAKNEGGMVVRDTINEISKRNVLVIASAGNDSSGPFSWHNNDTAPKFPAAFDSANLLVIASTTSTGSLSPFSNVGKVSVDVAAPGSNVYSTLNGNKYGMASGTSMAAPNTSGVAAMVLGYFPRLSVLQLKEVLTSTVTKVPAYADKMTSGGRINLKAALVRASRL
ncbi:MAG TPA: S8 family peptidase [Bacteriovoracaceae bacterium]|nr:S8 family peptidase [Bacteriovoracaceae bacterium]